MGQPLPSPPSWHPPACQGWLCPGSPVETHRSICPFPWGAQSLPSFSCTPTDPCQDNCCIDRALMAGGLAEEPYGKLCVACLEFPARCQHGVYLSECHARPSRAASPAPSAAQTAPGKGLAAGNEARADLHLLEWTTTDLHRRFPLPRGASLRCSSSLCSFGRRGVTIPVTYLRGCCEFS